jgi:NTE family protein
MLLLRADDIPLGVIATDMVTGEAAVFRNRGDVVLHIRASCSHPGLLQPLRFGDRFLVDGAISMEVPALLTPAAGHHTRDLLPSAHAG